MHGVWSQNLKTNLTGSKSGIYIFAPHRRLFIHKRHTLQKKAFASHSISHLLQVLFHWSVNRWVCGMTSSMNRFSFDSDVHISRIFVPQYQPNTKQSGAYWMIVNLKNLASFWILLRETSILAGFGGLDRWWNWPMFACRKYEKLTVTTIRWTLQSMVPRQVLQRMKLKVPNICLHFLEISVFPNQSRFSHTVI